MREGGRERSSAALCACAKACTCTRFVGHSLTACVGTTVTVSLTSCEQQRVIAHVFRHLDFDVTCLEENDQSPWQQIWRDKNVLFW
jgi:hypothetical protein